MRTCSLALILVLFSNIVFGEDREILPNPIRFATDEWCPHICPGEGGGTMTGLITQAFATHGIDVDVTYMGWSRALQVAKEGLFDGALGAAQRKSGEGFIVHREPLMLSELVIVRRMGLVWRYRDIPSLQAVKLGAVRNYWYSQALNQYLANNDGKENRVVLLSGEKAQANVVSLLKRGRLDAMVIDRQVYGYYFEPQAGNDLVVGALVTHVPLIAAFSPKKSYSQKLANILDAYLKARPSGVEGE